MAYACNNLSALRQKALNYYNENGIPKKMEEVLNSMFYDNPPDPYGYLVNYFSDFVESSKLKKISASLAFDGHGLPAIETDIFCTFCNKEKFICSLITSNRNIKTWLEERDKALTEMKASVHSAVSLINSELSDKLVGFDTSKQKDIDQLLISFMEVKKQREIEEKEKAVIDDNSTVSINNTPAIAPQAVKNKRKQSRNSARVTKSGNVNIPSPDKPLENFTLGSEAVAAISQAVCLSAAFSHNYKIYQHVASLVQPNISVSHYRLPLPMVTVIQGGRNVAGKQNFIKEFMVVPGVNLPLNRSIQYIADINAHVTKTLTLKFGASVKYVNENGALCPPLDVPNQGLDLIIEAINAQGLTLNKDMHLAINISANELFDHDKGKYEVTESVWKTPEEMVTYISDLLIKYPSIIAIIDPLRGEDSETWIKLCDKVSKSIFIVGDSFYSRPGLLTKEPVPTTTFTSGIVLHFENLNTVSDIIACAKIFQGLKNEIIMSTNEFETTENFLVDFSVGIEARFLKLGGVHTGERSCKINRLLQIYNELEHPDIGIIVEPEVKESSVPEEVEVIENKPTDTGSEELTAEKFTLEEKEETEEQEKIPEIEDDGKLHLKLHEPFSFPQINYPSLQNDVIATTETEEQKV
ncbi:Enolase 4 [Bulinus truncatus]|nr:Enolase 4 [Bulinus truncatus]